MLNGWQYSRLSRKLSAYEAFDVSYEPDFIFPFCKTPASDSNEKLSRRTLPFWYKHQNQSRCARTYGRCFIAYNHKRSYTRMMFLFTFLLCLLAIVLTVAAICYPSYSSPPAHYSLLARDCAVTSRPGCANPYREKVFIVATILDKNGKLIKGSWGAAVSKLVEFIGPENVFLSIYVNNADAITESGIKSFKSTLRCKCHPIL